MPKLRIVITDETGRVVYRSRLKHSDECAVQVEAVQKTMNGKDFGVVLIRENLRIRRVEAGA